LICPNKVEKDKIEEVEDSKKDVFILFADSPQPDGTPTNPIVKLLLECLYIDGDELETKKPLFAQLFGLLVTEDFTVRDLLDTAENVSKMDGRRFTAKVIMELIVQYVEFELFEMLRSNYIKNSQKDLLDKIWFAFTRMFDDLIKIQKFQPNRIFQHIIPRILVDLKSPSTESFYATPSYGEYAQLSFVVFPLVLLRLTLIISVLCGYSSFRPYENSFNQLINVVCLIYESYFKKIDEVVLNNPHLQSLDLSHRMFATVFAESIKIFVSSLPKPVRDSINERFIISQPQNDEPMFESFTDILFYKLLKKDIFKISDFRDILKKKDLLMGVKSFRKLYRCKIQENRNSDNFDDDD
jgi:hypothetical protein